jgi:hypothetical protein
MDPANASIQPIDYPVSETVVDFDGAACAVPNSPALRCREATGRNRSQPDSREPHLVKLGCTFSSQAMLDFVITYQISAGATHCEATQQESRNAYAHISLLICQVQPGQVTKVVSHNRWYGCPSTRAPLGGQHHGPTSQFQAKPRTGFQPLPAAAAPPISPAP